MAQTSLQFIIYTSLYVPSKIKIHYILKFISETILKARSNLFEKTPAGNVIMNRMEKKTKKVRLKVKILNFDVLISWKWHEPKKNMLAYYIKIIL